jgi:4'-phosphopantetheinyl transferase EntD
LTHKKGHVALAFETGFADCDDPGIDLELVRRLDDELALKVVNAYEMEIASQIGPAWSTAVFSAKESIFKCLFRQVGFRFYFEAAQLVDVCAAAHQGIMMFRMTRALGPNVAHNTLVRVDYKRITLGSEEFWLTSARRK